MTETTNDPTTTTTAATTADWLRFARYAAITMVIWAVLVHLTARVLIPPVLVIGLIYLAFVPFLRRERRWVGLGLAAFSALALLGNVPGLADELSNPESAPAFILTLLSVTAAVLAVISGSAAFFGWSTAPMRALAIGAVSVFAVGALSSLAIFVNTESDAALGSDVEVVAEKVLWEPEDIVLPAGSAGVWVENKDGIRHTFTIEELGVDLEIPALRARRVDVAGPAGTYEIICTVPGHENMIGTLTIEG